MAFFANAVNVDARDSEFNQIEGSQINYYGGPPWLPSSQRRRRVFVPSFPELKPKYPLPAPKFILEEEGPVITNSRDENDRPHRVFVPPPTTFNATIIHETELPTIGSFLDDALATVKTKRSPWKEPGEWIQEDTQYLSSIVPAIVQLTGSAEIKQADFTGQEMIFPRLVLYLFAHFMLCANDKTSLNDLKGALKDWKTWDGLTMIQNQQLMRNHLQELFQRSLQPRSDLHPKSLFNKLLTLDVIRLSAYLTVAVTDDVKCKALISQRGPGAQSLLNLLQARLDFSIDSAYKPRYIKTLVKLSRDSHQYPECLALEDIDIDEHPVAAGGYGDVFKGRLNGQLVAVKILKVYGDQDIDKFLKDFSSEAVIWRQLSHENVLPFCGVYRPKDNKSRVCLVAPWLENRNVIEFLKTNPVTDCVQLALDIALGLQYLHNLMPRIIHGDLKGFNILITRSRRACLADFGLAAVDSQTLAMTYASTARSGGTARWQAPELHNFDSDSGSTSQQNKEAIDIYAFACVCYEMFSDQMPFHNITRELQVLSRVVKGVRPARPSCDTSRNRGLTDAVWNLIEKCWAQDPAERPTATTVVDTLRSLPNRPQDTRPFDDQQSSTPSQVVYRTNHPFSALGPKNEDGADIQDLKWVSH